MEVFSGIKHAFDYLFRSRAEYKPLDGDQCIKIYLIMCDIEDDLSSFELEVDIRYRHRVDILNIIEKVRQSLRFEYGGVMPSEFIDIYPTKGLRWKSLPRTELEQFEGFLRKWLDETALENEFPFLRLDLKRGDRNVLFDTEKRASHTAEEMKKWLLARHGTLEF
ncbi:hypothetical protein MGYG_04743 [Nannizzia gypsea CBS 118893]|uniref:Uncharacterized protein n=1 Tax=Arthroderma gypseum (strain ATCC MYA-4604 / CBS 118893) TaxID=535722 RepID=E4UWI7_ARTGP|nr:hypothetical protein MGYG_04743 [Nannizzia gypsea CBS 118893]EFR01743.1 hypothetical protein MGYG_04743 [Nannizzia gypsea CBS 118893]